MGTDFRKLLVELAKGIKDDELVSLKFLVAGQIGKRRLEECTTVYDFWQALEQKELLSPSDVSYLKSMLSCALSDRNDLISLVNAYEEKCCIQEGSVTSSSTAVSPSASEEISIAIQYVAALVGKDWRQLARKMKLGESDISSVAEKHHGDLREQTMAALTMWLRRRPNADPGSPSTAVEELMQYLCSAGRKDVADNLYHRRHLSSPGLSR